jgi:hypothetical protein
MPGINPVSDPDLLLYLPFNGTTINEVDKSPAYFYKQNIFSPFYYESYIPSNKNALSLTTDRFGKADQALYFDGETFLDFSVPTINNKLDFTTDNFSLSCWVRISEFPPIYSQSNLISICRKGDLNSYASFYLFIDKYGFRVLSTYIYPTKNENPTIEIFSTADFSRLRDVYVHVCLTVKQKEFTLYLNGKRIANAVDEFVPQSFFSYSPSLDFKIGEKFKGALDEIQVYKRALSSSEVAGLVKF